MEMVRSRTTEEEETKIGGLNLKKRKTDEEETKICIHHLKKCKISDGLHDDILVQILQRLEADTLYSLRMVSKQWHNMILDPRFAISNLSYAGPPGCLLQCPLFGSYKLGFLDLRGGEVVLRDLRIDLPKPIMASCNGVVLFRNYPKRGDYSIGNILSRKGKILPLQHYNNSWLKKVLGFTYLKETKEYKIVCLMCKMCETQDDPSYCVMIFTLGSNTWTEVKEPEPKPEFAGSCCDWEAYAMVDFNEDSIQDFYPAVPVCVNNFLHSLIYTEEAGEVLVTIDTNNGTFHNSEIPFEYEPGELVNLGGVLALHSKQYMRIKIWIFKDFYRKEWTQLHCIIPEPGLEPFLIGNLGNGKVLLYSDLTTASCYALDPQSGKVIKTFPLYLAHRHFCVQHVGSLVSNKSL